jgi:putative Holliday junction resolvase
MRYLALDHGTKRIGVAVSDELKMIAQPLEYIPTEPFDAFLTRLKQLLVEKEVERMFIGMPRNMDGSYGPAAEKVREFIAVLKAEITTPIQTLDERLTSAQANRRVAARQCPPCRSQGKGRRHGGGDSPPELPR